MKKYHQPAIKTLQGHCRVMQEIISAFDTQGDGNQLSNSFEMEGDFPKTKSVWE